MVQLFLGCFRLSEPEPAFVHALACQRRGFLLSLPLESALEVCINVELGFWNTNADRDSFDCVLMV